MMVGRNLERDSSHLSPFIPGCYLVLHSVIRSLLTELYVTTAIGAVTAIIGVTISIRSFVGS